MNVNSPGVAPATTSRLALRGGARQARISIKSGPEDTYACEIVRTALVRSFSTAQVDARRAAPASCIVWINPTEQDDAEISRLVASGGKALVLGRVGPAVAEVLGLQLKPNVDFAHDWGECPQDITRHHNQSPASIRYDAVHPLARLSPLASRPLCRFDFADEWNNLGFGRVRLDGSPWSVQSAAEVGDAIAIAHLATPRDDRLAYAALRETASGAALWFNRAVGPVDSLEWRCVESLLADYRPDDLPCLACVSEIPHGYEAAACARLDCDEAVESSRAVFELYRDRGLPLSLAVLTGQPLAAGDFDLMRSVIAAGGAVVSHSVRHEPNWGGSYLRACDEARASRVWLDENLPCCAPVRYAVSPFHQNPPYSIAALADTGYEGFVGGIISSDPEYLLGRAGRVPLAPREIVSLSAQCMLHGDCYRRYGNSIDTYTQSFDAHHAARSIFGYLDHPFSARYQYGWTDEATRLAAHEALIDYVAGRGNIWWANLAEVLDFLRERDTSQVQVNSAGGLSVESSSAEPRRPLSISWKGRQFVY